jgi:ABC-type dipeptide/oligopeptide/nickel transport system ATPase subunit
VTTTEIGHVCHCSLQAPNAFIFSFLSNKKEERETGGRYYTCTLLMHSHDLAMALAIGTTIAMMNEKN